MPEADLIPPSPRYTDESPPPDDAAFFAESAPLALFASWLKQAREKEPNDPNAMALATVDADGLPDVRMVLLKDVGPEGFSFYTNFDSAKGRQLAAHPKAALCFHWKSLRRQVRVRGTISPVPAAEADAYFATRDRGARLGAWASAQSRPLETRLALEQAIAEHTVRFGLGDIPRPPHWGGLRLSPLSLEFWRDRPFRLHDRLRFDHGPDGWTRTRLFP